MPEVTSLKGIGEKDRQMIEGVEAMFGPEPSTMGFAKNLFWGRIQEQLVFPYPRVDAEETSRCENLLSKLDHYLEHEHPATRIDQEQEIPPWVIDRLFEMGVLGMLDPVGARCTAFEQRRPPRPALIHKRLWTLFTRIAAVCEAASLHPAA